MRRGPATIVAVVLLLAAPAGAAVPPWLEPEPRDHDAAEEAHSDFWERALHPNRELYENRVQRARSLMERRDPTKEEEAAELLTGAIEREPEIPDAYWYLAKLRERQERWSDCAQLRRRVLALDDEYTPPEGAHAVDGGFAYCASRAGRHEAAIARYKHVLRQGSTNHRWEVLWRLGESYMAIGRIGDAIQALEGAHRHYSGSARIMFTLAVAYDRDDQTAKARKYLSMALSRDPGLGKLTSSYVHYAPPEDRYYYEALGYEAKGEVEQALVRFRHYLRLTGDGPWRARVRYHIEALSGDSLDASRIHVTGAHGVDTASIVHAIRDASDDLDECMQPVPGVLLRVQITTLAPRRSRDRTGNDPEPGLRATVLYTFATDSDQVTEAVACVERVAGDIDVPTPTAKQGRYLQVRFPVVAR